MKNVYENIAKKINQGGSMMIEAMAMLALIALVTPTLYKKSAERTTELQDINTATQVRTLTKALDNYVSANYQALLEDESKLKNNDTVSLGLAKADGSPEDWIAPYLPYGYKFNELKNFGIPKVALKRKGDANEMAITTFVQFPKKTDIGEMRSARIASMIGSNGGYVSDTGAKGVGGVWELDNSSLGSLGFDQTSGSVVVASSEAINSATSGALENEKYLQRTAVENGETWRNTMSTDLYMGGTEGPSGSMSDMHKILGVEQMIIGATAADGKDYDLVISEDGTNGGSAYLAGSLMAAADQLFVDDLKMTYGDVILADNANKKVDFFVDAAGDGLVSFSETEAAISLNTFIDGTLQVTDTTQVATDGGMFSAGPGGKYIKAEDTQVSLLDGNILTTNDGTNKLTTINTNLDVEGTSNLKKTVKIGTESNAPAKITDPILDVQGNAYVSKKLEVGDEIITSNLDLLNLHAGGSDLASTDRWLHATADGVKVTDIGNGGAERLVLDSTTTGLYNKDKSSKMELGDSNAILQADEEVNIYSYKDDGTVELQDGALLLTGKLGATENNVTINASTTNVNTGNFKVGLDTNSEALFTVDTIEGGKTTVATKDTEIVSKQLKIEGNNLLQVLPGGYKTNSPSVVGIDKNTFVVTSGVGEYGDDGKYAMNGNEKEILRVDTVIPEDNVLYGSSSTTSDASVYIRRGGIVVEAETDGKSAGVADSGVGYVSASRFVSNATGGGSSVVTPVFSGDYTAENYSGASAYEYDRYMVNPAYTSVMHDIKLTTRGGARLSDVLPDFINKGIYVVSNTYKDNLNIDTMKGVVTNENGYVRVGVDGAEEVSASDGTYSGADQWASPYLGVVPAPQCPPGHARVITITPSGFMMSNAGSIIHTDAYNPYNGGGAEARWVVDPSANRNVDQLFEFDSSMQGEQTVSSPVYLPVEGETADATRYYLGYTDNTKGELHPLYFQQSTWLKSKVIPQAQNIEGNCQDHPSKCANFIGWSAIMGFLYHTNQYEKIISLVTANNYKSGYYWNVFPVLATTLEAYATVYCYFDRSNIYGNYMDANYVDQYDQLNNFRSGYHKSHTGVNVDYIKRLNDPTLKYDNPW